MIFVIISLLAACSKDQPNNYTTAWLKQTSGKYTSSLNSVYFTDSNNGYAVGDSGKIFKTTNGGLNWTVQTCPKQMAVGIPNIKSVSFMNADTGFAVGQTSIFKTINKGINWTAEFSTFIGDFHSIYFIGNIGYAVGSNDHENGIIIKTTNGGLNWTEQTSGTTNFLNSIYFVDANTGYVVGGNGIILKTIDGGTNWTAEISGTSNWLTSVYFIDVNTGYAIGISGTILKTTNGGTTWIAQSNPVNGKNVNLNSVFFKS